MSGNRRQEFERIFPNPDGVQWSAEWGDYWPAFPSSGRGVISAAFQNCRYQGWQVGRGIAQKNWALEPESA
ncbi:hypothetical protein ACJJIQ_00210 (plasmid) [Microbulbifer sp. ANSA003]|uniref:hypothetical protein n=1 Tax=Microbulbifer sp. ANSA003 TaxID=3243360 RepID=UPI00404281F3